MPVWRLQKQTNLRSVLTTSAHANGHRMPSGCKASSNDCVCPHDSRLANGVFGCRPSCSGPLPNPSPGHFPKLRFLDLDSNQFSGTIGAGWEGTGIFQLVGACLQIELCLDEWVLLACLLARPLFFARRCARSCTPLTAPCACLLDSAAAAGHAGVLGTCGLSLPT